MTGIDRAALRALADAATPGPWSVVHTPAWEADDVQHPAVVEVGARLWEGDDLPLTICRVSTDYEDAEEDVYADAAFIAAAREAVPALLDEVERLTALVNAKQSWIDGAKVDMAAMEEERAKALAAIALAGEEIERASVEVKRADRQRDDARAAIAAVRALHRNDGGTCPTCLVGTTPFPQPAPWPCATWVATDGLWCACGAHLYAECPTLKALDGE